MNDTAALENPPLDLSISDTMKSSYGDYSLSVIVDRALPDARDGLKPVHRRVMHAMNQLNIGPGSAHKKSARVVGETLGKYHPHGDTACYDAMVRMAQPWAMRHPLVDGQGNFGSVDGDSPAAMRYTEVRMSRIGASLFADIHKDTVDFRDNFDGSEQEPTVLPLAFPNLWVNGVQGIAVGMATSVPPHNLRETTQAFLAWMEAPETITTQALAERMPGPDFPTGGILHGMEGYMQALDTGRGSVKLRSKWTTEKRPRGGSRLVINEIPYAVNKARLVEQMADLVRERAIDGVSDMRDESNKKGIRIVLDVKSGFEPELIAIQLVALTALEVSISYNVMALVGPNPVQMGVREVFTHFRDHRIEVIQRRTRFELNKTLERLHILDGFLRAMDHLDATIATIRGSQDAEWARHGLMSLLSIDAVQAQAILDLRLQRLTGLQILELRKEHDTLTAQAEDLRDILARPERQQSILREELLHVCNQFASERMTTIDSSLSKVTRADLIPEERVLMIGTQQGYLKRLSADAMNRQRRGTKGRAIIDLGEDDIVTTFHAGHSHDTLIALTDQGRVHAVKAYNVPDTGLGNRGRHYRNIFENLHGDVVAMLSAENFEDPSASLVIFTASGTIKRTLLSAFSSATRSGGIVGITLNEDDRIVCARISHDEATESVVMVSSGSRAIRFPMSDVRAIGRTSQGMRGMRLKEGETVIAADIVPEEALNRGAALLVVTGNGHGKATALEEFSLQGRAGGGMLAHVGNQRTGGMVAATILFNDMDVIVFNEAGGANRICGSDVPRNGRATGGNRLINNGQVRSVLTVPPREINDEDFDAFESAETPEG